MGDLKLTGWLIFVPSAVLALSQLRYAFVRIGGARIGRRMTKQRRDGLPTGAIGKWDILTDEELLASLKAPKPIKGYPTHRTGRRPLTAVRARVYAGTAQSEFRVKQSLGQVGVLLSSAVLALSLTELAPLVESNKPSSSEPTAVWAAVTLVAAAIGLYSIRRITYSASLEGLAAYYRSVASRPERDDLAGPEASRSGQKPTGFEIPKLVPEVGSGAKPWMADSKGWIRWVAASIATAAIVMAGRRKKGRRR